MELPVFEVVRALKIERMKNSKLLWSRELPVLEDPMIFSIVFLLFWSHCLRYFIIHTYFYFSYVIYMFCLGIYNLLDIFMVKANFSLNTCQLLACKSKISSCHGKICRSFLKDGILIRFGFKFWSSDFFFYKWPIIQIGLRTFYLVEKCQL